MRIVVVGDSIVWGQGLQHEDKFVRIVADELGEEIELPADFLAHSGAILGEFPPDASPCVDARISDFTARGEVPCDRPTVNQQLDAIEDPGSVDLLILDGGANNLDGGFFLTLIDFTLTLPDLEERVTKAFRGAPLLIRKARKTCPNAVIVYTGYYAGVSRETKEDLLDGLIAVAAVGWDPVTALAMDRVRNSIIINNLFFGHDQLHHLREAISGAMSDPEVRGPGVLLAHPRFGPENALGAQGGDAWVQFVTGELTADPQYDVRQDACRIQHGPDVDAAVARLEGFVQSGTIDTVELLDMQDEVVGRPLERFTCEIAGCFHPNEEGARKGYARAILDAVRSNQSVSVHEIVSELAPESGSLVRGLGRYGLMDVRDVEGRVSVRDVNQHRVADVLRVAIWTGDRSGPFGGGEGTDHEIHLDVGPRSWHLTRAAGRSKVRHPLDEFEASDSAHVFTVDPSYDPVNGTGEGQLLRLSEITRVRIRKVADQPALSPDFFLGNVQLVLNERVVVYDAGADTGADDPIGVALTNQDPVWTSADAGTPQYPRPE